LLGWPAFLISVECVLCVCSWPRYPVPVQSSTPRVVVRIESDHDATLHEDLPHLRVRPWERVSCRPPLLAALLLCTLAITLPLSARLISSASVHTAHVLSHNVVYPLLCNSHHTHPPPTPHPSIYHPALINHLHPLPPPRLVPTVGARRGRRDQHLGCGHGGGDQARAGRLRSHGPRHPALRPTAAGTARGPPRVVCHAGPATKVQI
jgi:hypothetical protein